MLPVRVRRETPIILKTAMKIANMTITTSPTTIRANAVIVSVNVPAVIPATTALTIRIPTMINGIAEMRVIYPKN
jgi:hypothetical protein